MITVVGEALVDVVISPSGEVTAVSGGAPFNTARACARLGVEVAFVGALSTDRFGRRLADDLRDDGVDLSRSPGVQLPTTLAVAEVDERGAATYRFYVEATSAPQLTDRPDLADSDVVFTGGLALVLEPMASVVEAMLAPRPRAMVMIDVNCRPPLITDRDVYRVRVERVAATADIVKASDDDLGYLYPGVEPAEAARRLATLGVGIVLVTRGSSGVDVVTPSGTAHVPVEPVDVVDTVGAGDTFDGALLAWLVANDALSSDRLSRDRITRAVGAASAAAGLACTRRGADPPRRSELSDSWWS